MMTNSSTQRKKELIRGWLSMILGVFILLGACISIFIVLFSRYAINVANSDETYIYIYIVSRVLVTLLFILGFLLASDGYKQITNKGDKNTVVMKK